VEVVSIGEIELFSNLHQDTSPDIPVRFVGEPELYKLVHCVPVRATFQNETSSSRPFTARVPSDRDPIRKGAVVTVLEPTLEAASEEAELPFVVVQLPPVQTVRFCPGIVPLPS
jgi:hypothetical protein